jgi:hypothetical protein
MLYKSKTAQSAVKIKAKFGVIFDEERKKVKSKGFKML